MKLSLLSRMIIMLVITFSFSCKPDTEEPALDTQECFGNTQISLKWYNTATVIETYSDASLKTKIGTQTLGVTGFLKIDPAGTYEIVRNDISSVGTWKLDSKSCKLLLDDKAITSVDAQYDVLNLTVNTLKIKRTIGNTVVTESYNAMTCPNTSLLLKQWDNTKTYFFDYNANANLISNPVLIFPRGYFKLNIDQTYNVLSDGTPLNGNWKLGEPYCTLDLDTGKPLARSFEIVKINNDSLVIWRKDGLAGKAYLQYYSKH